MGEQYLTRPKQSEKEYVILDWREVNRIHVQIIIISLVIFSILAYILFAVLQIAEILIAGLLAVLIQLLFGMIATRKFNSLGIKGKSKLDFLDPATLNSDWKVFKFEVKNSELDRYFEKIHYGLEKLDVERTDDINDLMWFGVTVWAIGGLLIFSIFETLVLLSLFAPIVMAGLSIVAYYFGYNTSMNGHYNDELEHLEFLIKKKLASVKGVKPKATKVYLSWKVKGRKYVLYDIITVIDFNGENKGEISYSVGLPSTEKEKFSVIYTNSTKSNTFTLDSKLEEIWKISSESTEPNRIQIENIRSSIDLSKRETFVTISNDIETMEEILKQIIDVFF